MAMDGVVSILTQDSILGKVSIIATVESDLAVDLSRYKQVNEALSYVCNKAYLNRDVAERSDLR